MNETVIQLWHHSVNITNENLWPTAAEEKKQPLDTLRKLIESVFAETGKPFVKIMFQEIDGRGKNMRSLFLWILERNLCLLKLSDPDTITNGEKTEMLLMEHTVMKVL